MNYRVYKYTLNIFLYFILKNYWISVEERMNLEGGKGNGLKIIKNEDSHSSSSVKVACVLWISIVREVANKGSKNKLFFKVDFKIYFFLFLHHDLQRCQSYGFRQTMAHNGTHQQYQLHSRSISKFFMIPCTFYKV